MRELAKARQHYHDIVDGHENHWLDPGEYEYLKQKWFDDYALKFIESVEQYRDSALERGERD